MLGGKLFISVAVSSTGFKLVDVGKNANTGSLMTCDVVMVVLQGIVPLLNVAGTTNLVIDGGRVLGGGINRQNSEGPTSICGAVVRGGILLQNVVGPLNAKVMNTCAKSAIPGTIDLANTKGNVKVGGGILLAAEFINTKVDGNVELSNTQVSDVVINGV